MLGLLEKERPILSVREQIEHLKSKGIKFDICSESEAVNYLESNNNYFKLRAYRKNFEKYKGGAKDGQYIDLDFAMLKDMAVIDMKLRYILLLMSLDIEHFGKVKLLKHITESGNDGYSIVKEYIEMLMDSEINKKQERKPYTTLMNEISRNRSNPYCSGIVQKYNGNYPVWVFSEVISFGSFIHFTAFCADYLKNKDFKNDYYLMLSVKNIRNAAAHSNCIINDLSLKTAVHTANYDMVRALSSAGISKSIRNRKLSNQSLQDITTLLYTHKKIVTSEGVHKAQGKALNDMTDRCYRHIDYYKNNDLIVSSFDFFKKIVDIFFKM